MLIQINNDDIEQAVATSVMDNLGLETRWIGDPSTSTFGVEITLTWRGCPFTTSIIDYISKD